MLGTWYTIPCMYSVTFLFWWPSQWPERVKNRFTHSFALNYGERLESVKSGRLYLSVCWLHPLSKSTSLLACRESQNPVCIGCVVIWYMDIVCRYVLFIYFPELTYDWCYICWQKHRQLVRKGGQEMFLLSTSERCPVIFTSQFPITILLLPHIERPERPHSLTVLISCWRCVTDAYLDLDALYRVSRWTIL